MADAILALIPKGLRLLLVEDELELELVGILAYWPALWLARQAAKHDPDWLAVYFRSLGHSLKPVREPHGYAYTRDSKPPEILPPAPKWIK